MKSRSSSFLPLFSIVVTVGLSPLHALTVDTAPGGIPTTITLNTDNPGNQYIGNGTLQVSANGADVLVELANNGGAPNTQFYMTAGGLITIDSGVTLRNGGWSKGFWINGSTPNKADMMVNGTLDLWDGNPVYVNALNGAGAINISTAYGTGVSLNVGVDGGGGTYSGTIATGTDARPLQIVKSGAGTQTFDNLANQKPKKFILNAGVVSLSVPPAGDVTLASGISGVGKLTKSGTGKLTLSGTVTHTGVVTVSEGTLSMGTNLASPNWVIASGAVLDLNFTGEKAVTSLEIGSSGPLPPGLYNSSHSTYGSSFSGTGTLRILGEIPLNSGVWTSLANGNWTDNPNWQGNTIASGAGNTATFNAATGVTVTLDAGMTIGHLAFDVSDYTISGSNNLTLDATSPSITVAGGRTATISSIIAGTAGLTKLDAGLLTLSGLNSYTGGTTVSAGQLKLVNNKTGSSTFITNSDLEFNLTSGNQTLMGGSITGAGNLIKTGGSDLTLGGQWGQQTIALTGAASIIDVQGGNLRNDWGNSAWGNNKAGLKIAGGANFNIHDGNATVDELDGSGGIGKWWGTGTSTLTIGVNNGSGTFGGTISNSTGNLALVKKGSGTQILTGSNTHSGNTTISAGILSLGNSLALQNSILDTANSIAGDATNGLQTTVTSLTLGGLTGNKDLASVFTTASGGYDTLTSLTLNLGSGLYRSYTGVIAEGAAGMTLTKSGLGALSLAGVNTYPGDTAVSGGVLALQKSSTSSITVAANAGLGLVVGGAGGYTLADVDSLFAGSLSGVTMDPTSLAGIDTSLGDLIYSSSPVTTNGFTKTGINTLTLDGINAAAFGGGTTVYAGVLSLANTAAKPSATVTVNAGAGLALAVGDSGAGYFTTADVDSLWAGSLSGVALNAASLVGIDTTQGDLTYTTPASTLTRGFAKVGSGILTLTGANAYTGGTVVGAGRLVLVNTMTGSSNYLTNGELEINLTTGNKQINGGTFSGTGKLIKTGASELIFGNNGSVQTVALKGADSVIDIQVGKLSHFQWVYDGWVGNEAGLTVATGATFELGNTNVTVDELNGTGTINKGQWNAANTLTIGVKDGSGSFSGTISDPALTLALVKQGAGTQTLSGTITYRGGTTVNGGRLILLNTLTGNTSYTTNAELVFDLTTGNQQIQSGTSSGTGKLIKTGASAMILGNWGGAPTVALKGIDSVIDVQEGTLEHFGAAAYSAPAVNWSGNEAGLTVGTGATFHMNNNNAIVDELNGAGTISKDTWNNAVTLTIGVNNGSGTFSGAIVMPNQFQPALSLVKQGTGTQTLSGTNNYTGGTTIAGGTLALGANNVLPGTPVSIGNATLDAATFTDAVGTLDVTAAATINLGSGAALAFADSKAIDWTDGTLNIIGTLGATSLRFGDSADDLTGAQLAKITVNGSGTYTLDANGYLVAGSSNPYAGWATGSEAFDGDANGDGVQDGLAWFLGAATPADNALDQLPKPAKDGAFLTLDFKRVNPYSPAKLFVEFGNDLSGWTVAEIPAAAGTIDLPGDDVVVEVTGTSPEDVKVKIPITYQSASGALFARLRATSN